jgi:hypothetical protein
MDFDAFIAAGWNDHADRPEEVADRLAASRHLLSAPAHVAPFARLLTHVVGEHLGQWQRGLDLLESLKALPAFDGSEAVAAPIARSTAVLRYAGGDRGALAGLGVEDRVHVLSTAASALAGRLDYSGAIETFRQAVAHAESLAAGSLAFRALAVGGNNLAATLEEKPDRDASETEGMVAAAEAGLKFWKLAGTWLEEERAEYRLARSLLQAGRAADAAIAAQRCLAVCRTNDAPAFERFFAHAAIAMAHRAAGQSDRFAAERALAVECLERIDPAERGWCESDLKELGVGEAPAATPTTAR